MPGLDPGIHPLRKKAFFEEGWIAGSSPAMTGERASPVSESTMSEDFLKNPLSLFDIRGKTAIVTGASGAFGALAAKVLAGAGANVVISAAGADILKKVAADCLALGGNVETVALRPSSEANCDKIVE